MHNVVRAKIIVGIGLLAVMQAAAQPVIETSDRLEINWSTLKLRFFGQASSIEADGWKAAEKKAWQDGIAYVQAAVHELNTDGTSTSQQDEQELRELSKQLAKTTLSVSTTYFADGSLRVLLENQLPRAFLSQNIRFRQKEIPTLGMQEHTGVLLRLDKSIKPSARYKIVDGQGQVLFDVHDMAESAFRKHLMGRWLKRPTSAEVTDMLGKSPIIFDAQVLARGLFKIDRALWDERMDGHNSLLVTGTVGLALP